MCTSLALPSPDGTHLFGRTLDLDTHFGEAVTLTPRRYPFTFDGCPLSPVTTPCWVWPPSWTVPPPEATPSTPRP